MSESLKSVLVLTAGVAAIASAVGWVDDRPDAGTWCLRVLPAAACGLILGLILREHFRPDLAPDLLRRRAGGYFDRGGFAFSVEVAVTRDRAGGNPTATLVVPFQNQRDAPAEATVAVRGGRRFWLTRGGLGGARVRIVCPPAAYGEARAPFPVPRELQGTRRKLEVGATVRRPGGKGRLVRFRPGLTLNWSADFKDRGGCLLTGLGLLTGAALFYRGPATVTVALPEGVRDDVPPGAEPAVALLWDGWGRDE